MAYSQCLSVVAPEIFQELGRDRAILLACPEMESHTYYGKVASMIRSCEPEEIVVAAV